MTKDVLVNITGAHMADGQTDDISLITAGTYYLKNGKHYIIYEEAPEEGPGAIRNTIKIGKGKIEMIKNLDVRTHMIFEEDKTNVSCFVTPFGQMMVGVSTDRIQMEEQPDRLKVKIDYTLEVNYQKMSQCHIDIEVSSRASASLNLSGKQEEPEEQAGKGAQGQ